MAQPCLFMLSTLCDAHFQSTIAPIFQLKAQNASIGNKITGAGPRPHDCCAIFGDGKHPMIDCGGGTFGGWEGKLSRTAEINDQRRG